MRTRWILAAGLAVLTLATLALLGAPLGVTTPQYVNSGPVVRTLSLGQNTDLSPVRPIAIDVRAGHVFVLTLGEGSNAALVSMLSALTGSLVRTGPVGDVFGGGNGALAADYRSGHVFVAVDGLRETPPTTNSHPPIVAELDARTGVIQNTTAIRTDPTAVVIDEQTQRVFITSGGYGEIHEGKSIVRDSGVSILDAPTGRLLRVTAVYGSAVAMAVDKGAHRVIVISKETVGPDSAGGQLSLLDARTGRLIHSAFLPGMTRRSLPMVAVDSVAHHAFITEDHALVVFDTMTGMRLRTIMTRGVPAMLAVDERTKRVFVADYTSSSNPEGLGRILVLDTISGQVKRSITVIGHPYGIAVDARRNRVLVTNTGYINRQGVVTRTGGVLVLDASNGAVLRTISVIGVPFAVAVDDQTGHAFVVSAPGMSASTNAGRGTSVSMLNLSA